VKKSSNGLDNNVFNFYLQNMRNGKALLGILAGVAAGAAIGLLFAPEKGDRTRRNIVRKGENLSDAINDKIDEKFDELLSSLTGKIKKSNGNEPERKMKSESVV
jgi:gas vesicle protein